MYQGMNRVHDRWSIWTNIQYRSHDSGINIEQMLLRTSANYHFSKNLLICEGYTYVPSYAFEGDVLNPSIEENRIFEQLLIKQLAPHVFIEHRLMLEHRWTDIFYKNRFRYRLFLTIPLNKKYIEGYTWFFALYDEVFLNIQNEAFDRNRIYGALGYQFNEYTGMHVGMLNQSLKNYDKWYFQLMLVWNPDFRSEIK